MKRKTKKILKISTILIILSALLFYFYNIISLSIIPELDNRINYFDTETDMSGFVAKNTICNEKCNSVNTCSKCSPSEPKIYENDKFEIETVNSGQSYGSITYGIYSNRISLLNSKSGANIRLNVKKDFTRLNTFIRFIGELKISGNEFTSTSYHPFQSGASNAENIWSNLEIKPDNLNIGVYDIFIDGEFIRKITLPEDKLLISLRAPSGNSGRETYVSELDYIKYIPTESFTIKNDEVWVQEVRGSDYSYSDLNWEMIGYQSQIRPATIRDLTQQIEVPTPQIYVNLINNQKVTVQPNTVHTFYYRTKWVEGLDSSCKGQLDKVERKVGDRWVCESYVKETPIIQQCQTKADCAILPECESQKELISCNNNLCDYSQFSIACKNQLITYQEKVTEIENTKFVPIISSGNSFYCFFDETQSSCNIGGKTISISSPQNTCSVTGSDIISNSDCFRTTISFNGKNYITKNTQEINVDFNIKITPSIGATYTEKGLRKGWSIVTKVILPDNFLDITPKTLGNKFVLQNTNDQISFIINNKLGFGIDGGYSLQTQNLALEGGVVLQDIDAPLFLKSGENVVTYNFKTQQLGTIVDIIGVFGKVKTDKEYILKSSVDGKEKLLIITKEVKTEIPNDLPLVQYVNTTIETPVDRIVEKEVIREVDKIINIEKIPKWTYLIIILLILFILILIIFKKNR